MDFYKALKVDISIIKRIVYETISLIYPKYYPMDVVDFFLSHHNHDNILQDLTNQNIYLLKINSEIVGTGSIQEDNHISRVFVLPELQKNNYGSIIMDHLENIISNHNTKAILDSSLPAYGIYLKRGYKPIEYKNITTSNGFVLCYNIMEKPLNRRNSYDNRIFSPVSNSSKGNISEKTCFFYHQKDDIVWAEYSGGEILKGFLVGKVDTELNLEFNYQHINSDMEIRIGNCKSVPKVLPNGKLQLYESWQWLNGDCSKGQSILEEL